MLSHINSYEHLAKSALFPDCKEKVVHGINLVKIRPDMERVIPKYLSACLESERFINKARSFAQRAVNQASIKISDLKEITIPLPPLTVQEEIVAEIEGYQKIINGARQVVENYKPTIKVDTSWSMVRIGDFCELQAGGTPQRGEDSYWDHNDYPWYTSGELNDIVTHEPLKYISKLGFENSSARLFPKGSLLIGMYDTAAFKMSILDREATFNQAVCGVKPNPQIDMLFLLLYFSGNREIYLKKRVGARQRNLTKQFISDLMIPVPPMEEQLSIIQNVLEELEIVNQNKRLIEIFQQKIKDKIAEVWGE